MTAYKTLIVTMIWLLCGLVCSARGLNYVLSPPLKVNETGWNKVLCMKNGSTVLFHFEPAKKIMVKVFDSTHKEIATRKDRYKLLDIFLVHYSVFKGLYDINGDAVLFIDQDQRGKHRLIMLRYNATTGKLIEERLVGESKSENRRIKFYVMKNKEDDNYEILFCMDKRHPKQSDIYMVYFNKLHQAIREVQLEVERKKYDYLNVIGAESQPNGVLITLALDKAIVYSRATNFDVELFAKSDHDSALQAGSSMYEHFVSWYYFPKEDSSVRRNTVDVSEAVYPYKGIYTYNAFARSVNLLVYNYKPVYYRFGLDEYYGAISSDLLFNVDEQDMSAIVRTVRPPRRNGSGRIKIDSTSLAMGIPVKMFTNTNGLTTILSQTCERHGELETNVLYDYQDYFGDIVVSQIDDTGKEIWSTSLAMAQYYKSNTAYLDEGQFCTRWQEQVIFGDLPEQVYNRQFLSFNSISYGKDIFIIANDYNRNIANTVYGKVDTVYGFEKTNAFYYKIDKKKEVTKMFLYGEDINNKWLSSFVEGACFDEQRGMYVSLVRQHKHSGKNSLHMAWSSLQ